MQLSFRTLVPDPAKIRGPVLALTKRYVSGNGGLFVNGKHRGNAILVGCKASWVHPGGDVLSLLAVPVPSPALSFGDVKVQTISTTLIESVGPSGRSQSRLPGTAAGSSRNFQELESGQKRRRRRQPVVSAYSMGFQTRQVITYAEICL